MIARLLFFFAAGFPRADGLAIEAPGD